MCVHNASNKRKHGDRERLKGVKGRSRGVGKGVKRSIHIERGEGLEDELKMVLHCVHL